MKGDMDDSVDTSMLDLFCAEVATHAAALESGLVELEADPGAGDTMESLMRAAHSIKGAARIVGLDTAVGLAHVMEDLFVAVQNGRLVITPEAVDLLLQGVDKFKNLASTDPGRIEAWLKDRESELSALCQSFGAVLSGKPADKPAEAATKPKPEPSDKKPAAPVRKETGSPEPATVGADSAVLVSSDSLNRLMGLAGECMVESRRLQTFIQRFLHLRMGHDRIIVSLEQIGKALDAGGSDNSARDILAMASAKVRESRQDLTGSMEQFESYSHRSEELNSRLYNEAVASRMRPFSDGVKGFPRLVRDMARRLGKKITLEIVGESTRVDRDILARLEAPLNHLLRNSCDHGLETPDERRVAGKPEQGMIRLTAAHRAGMLFISVSDDGRGIDSEAVREKVIKKNLAAPEMVKKMTEPELMDFLFLPGFSTTKSVSEISGRGVGLDVVLSMVQEVGGSIRVVPQPGKGAAFQLQLPLTLSVLRALLVDIAGEPYAFALSRVDRILKAPKQDIKLIEDRQYYPFDGANIGLVPGYQPLGINHSGSTGNDFPIVVISDRLNRYGIVVDQLLGERELVVQPLDPRLGKVPNVSAAAIMEDGSPVLILDADDMVRSVDNMLTNGSMEKLGRREPETSRRQIKRILVVDDSITVREVERRLLENRGYKVDVAVDGMDGWNRLRSGQYDLVVSDVDMPRMNGIEMVGHIKQDPDLKSLPVMIVSYKDQDEDRARGLDAGANYYLTKSSFHDQSLINAVIDLIGEP